MDIAEAMLLLDVLLPKPLNDLHTLVFQQSWDSKSYAEIAKVSQYDETYIKSVGSLLWKTLSEATGETVTKSNVRSCLEVFARTRGVVLRSSSALGNEVASHTPVRNSLNQPRRDWGEAIDVSVFFGRTDELRTLHQWVESDRCRLIVVLGMGGIGKTALAIKLARQLTQEESQGKRDGVMSDFHYVIWRSLRNAPPLETLLSELIYFLSDRQDAQIDLNQLLHHLRSSRCLLVLDNLETLLADGSPCGQFRTEYEEYGELLRLLGEVDHNSCAIITSREKPAVVAAYEGENLPVRSLALRGSAEIARALLNLKDLKGTEEDRQLLGDRYSNTPLALKIVATSIQYLFDGQISDFLDHDTFVFNGIRRLLDRQFQRLSALEQKILYWLAIDREGTSVAQLQEDIVPKVLKADLLEALESLTGRSLLEKQAGGYTQQPVVMEYATDKLLDQMLQELISGKFSTFLDYPLVKTTVKDYIREAQSRLILAPIAERLLAALGSMQAASSHLRGALAILQTLPANTVNYGAGNLINLCLHLNADLSGSDFSNLKICHACLQGKKLHRVNFTRATFVNCTFSETFGNVLSIAFSPNGDWIATGDANNLIHLWGVEGRQPLKIFEGHTDWVRSLVFSPDSQTLIAGSDDQTIRFWNVVAGTCQHILSGSASRIASLALSPDGSLLASSSEDGSVYLWDVSQRSLLRCLERHEQPIWSVAFSPDGKEIASGSEDRAVRLWNVETGECLKVLEGHSDWVQSVAFSPDGRFLASGSYDRTIKVWDAGTRSCLHALLGHANWVWSVAISPDSKFLASASEDRTIRLWDIESGECLKIFRGHHCRIWSIAFHPDGKLLASGSDDRAIRVWDIATGQCLRTLQGYSCKIFPVAYSPNGRVLASGGDEPILRFWDTNTWDFWQTAENCDSRIESVAFSPDSRTLISGGEDKILRIWDVGSGQCLKRLEGSVKQIWTVAYSSDGGTIATSGEDGNIWLWDSETGQRLQVIEGHGNWVLTIAFSPDGLYLGSASHDRTIKLWDVKAGECIDTLSGHANAVTGVAFNCDGTLLASGSFDRTVRLWDIKAATTIRILEGHTDIIVPVVFSPSNILASGSFDRTIKLWDIATGACLRTLVGHTEPIYSLSFHPNGTTLASGSWDESVGIWDIKTGECLRMLKSDRPYEGINIAGAAGLSESQKATLKMLGALELEY